MNEPKIKILYIDDDIAGATLTRMVIEQEPDMEIVTHLAHAEKLEDEVERTNPDVVLLDIGLPGRDSIDALRGVIARFPQCRVLMFSGRDDEATVNTALAAGAFGFITKGRDVDAVLNSIRRTAKGERVLPR